MDEDENVLHNYNGDWRPCRFGPSTLFFRCNFLLFGLLSSLYFLDDGFQRGFVTLSMFTLLFAFVGDGQQTTFFCSFGNLPTTCDFPSFPCPIIVARVIRTQCLALISSARVHCALTINYLGTTKSQQKETPKKRNATRKKWKEIINAKVK